MAAPAPTVKVYYGKPMLPDVSRVLACLYEKDVKFDLIDMYEGQQINPDLIKFQASRAPVSGFEDGDIRLFESRAICRHIVDKYADRGNKYLLGRDLLERASIEQWLKSEEHSFDPPSWALVFHLAFKVEPDRALITESERRLSKVLDVYEQRLAESKFLAGEEFSLADLSHLPNSHYLARSREWSYLFESRKNVSKWWEEISSRHSWQQVVKILNEFGLLKNLNGISTGDYQFLYQKKLDLRSPVSDAPSKQTEEQTSSTQPAATDSPPSQVQGQKVQLASEADSIGQSIPQQTTSTAQQSVTKDARPDAQQGQKDQPKPPADSVATQPATTSAPSGQTKGEQQAHLADSSGESSATKIAPDTKSASQLPGSPVSKDQEEITQAIQEGRVIGLPSSLSSTKQEQISPTNGQRDSSSQPHEQKAPLAESTTEQAAQQAQAQTVDKFTKEQPAPAAPSSPEPKQTTQQTEQEKLSGQRDVQEGQTNVQYSSISGKKQEQDTNSVSTEGSAGKSIPQGQAMTDAQPYTQPLTSGAQSGQKREPYDQQQSFNQASNKKGPTDAQPYTQEGPPDAMPMKMPEQGPTDEQATGEGKSPEAPTSAKSTTPDDKYSQRQQQGSMQTSQGTSSVDTFAKQGPTDAQLSTGKAPPAAEVLNEKADAKVTQADSPGQSADEQATGEGKSSKAPTSAESKTPDDQYSQKQQGSMLTSQETSSVVTFAKQGPTDAQLSTGKAPPAAEVLNEKADAKVTQADSAGQSADEQATGEGKSSKAPTPTEPTTPDDHFSQKQQGTMQTLQETSSVDTFAKQGPTDAQLSTGKAPPTEVSSKKEVENAKVPEANSPGKSADGQATGEGKSSTSADTVASQGPTPGKLSTQQGPPGEILSDKQEENTKVAKADSPGPSAAQQFTGEGKSSNATTSSEATSENDITGGSKN